MPTPVPTGLRLGVIEPKAAIEAFQRRRLLQPTFHYLDVFQEEHARSFAVAGVQRLDLLQLFQAELDRKFADAGTLADFRKAIRPALVEKGWWGDVEVSDPATGETRITRFDNRRLALIYDTNVRQSYAAGRWAAIERNRKAQPFVCYRTMDDAHVRPEHRAWHNLVLPVDHEFWREHFPPNGWRCRCHAFALSQAGIEKLQKAGQKLKFEAPPISELPYVNQRTGEVARVPRGVDPGFAYNPGRMRDAQLHDTLLRKAMASPAYSGAVVMAQAAADHPAMVAQAAERFADWFDDLVARGQARGELQHLGVIPPAALRSMERSGLQQPLSAVVSVRDEDILHALRDAKASPIAQGVLRRLPELLQRATAVVHEVDADPPVLLFVIDLVNEDGSVAKAVVKLDQAVKTRHEGRRATAVVNVVRTVTALDPKVLGNPAKYRVLWGRL